MIRALVLAALIPSAAHAHCHRVWHYPYPQPGCGVYARVSAPASDGKTWFVEITKLPPLTEDEVREWAVEKLKEQLQ